MIHIGNDICYEKRTGFIYKRKYYNSVVYYAPIEYVGKLELEKYLTFIKELDVKNLTMQDMLYWSEHNIFSYINVIFTLALKKSKEKDRKFNLNTK